VADVRIDRPAETDSAQVPDESCGAQMEER
jgi:hypothetical protein